MEPCRRFFRDIEEPVAAGEGALPTRRKFLPSLALRDTMVLG
jgi:hypothetical protein